MLCSLHLAIPTNNNGYACIAGLERKQNGIEILLEGDRVTKEVG